MPRSRHYSPEIRHDLVTKLYFRAKAEKVPMTKLTNRLLDEALSGVELQREPRVAESPTPSATQQDAA